MFFTFDPTAKADLELEIVNQKAAELKKVEENRPDDAKSILNALDNYQESQKQLKVYLENLKENSQNPDVDDLIEQLVTHSVRHEKLLDELAKKFENQADVENLAKLIKKVVEDSAAAGAEKDDPAKFISKLEKALVEVSGGDLKHIQSLELLDRFAGKAPEDLRFAIDNLKEDFSIRAYEQLKAELKKNKNLDEVFDLPGDLVARTKILKEVQEESDPEMARALAKTVADIAPQVKEEEATKERVFEALERAEKAIGNLGSKTGLTDAQNRLLINAREHYDTAKIAYESQSYGKAFGEATAAEKIAINALRTADRVNSSDNLKTLLEIAAAKIKGYESWLQSLKLTDKQEAEAALLLDNAKKHLELAQAAFEKDNFNETRTQINHARNASEKLYAFLESFTETARPVPPTDVKPSPAPEPYTCYSIRQDLAGLDKMLASGEISKETYETKVAVLKKDLETCSIPEAKPAPVPENDRCALYRQKFTDLEKMLASGLINKEDYELKRALLRKEESPCPVRGAIIKPETIPSKIIESVEPAPTRNVVCTEEYKPVCGSNGKSYSNACFAKADGISVNYEGACKPVTEEKPSVY